MASIFFVSMEKSLGCKMKNILVIAYKFPPMGGIGTRRWTKFAKYFAKRGYQVHVLTINYHKTDEINWLHDIKDNKNIIIHKIKSGYPLWLMSYSKIKPFAFIQKVINFFLKKTFFYIDIAQNWAKYMLPYAKKLINENNIKNVIVTNPPPSVAYFSTFLKIEIPTINLIQDFRDSWNDDIDYDYPNTLKFFWQKEKSAYMEWFVINHSDYIVNVTEDITRRVSNKFKNYKEKFITIHNGYDKDDYPLNSQNLYNELDRNKIKIIYAGELGLGRIKAIEMIMDSLLDLNKERLKKMEINIYTSYNKNKLDRKYSVLFEQKIVNFYSLVPPTEIMKIINEHQYCLSINSPIYPYAFGTKVFDYMLLGKQIIHISNGGELARLLKSMKQYVVWYEKKQIKDILHRILNESEVNKVNDYSRFDIENLISKFERLLINE